MLTYVYILLQVRGSYDNILSVKPVKYTRHSKNRMRLHRIKESEIESAINNPDFIESSSEGKLNVWLKVSEKYLRVTYKQESDKNLVITAVKKKKGWR